MIGVNIIGIEKIPEPELIMGVLTALRRNGVKLPKKIIFKNIPSCYGKAAYDGAYMKIRINQPFARMCYTIIHEAVHCIGRRNHDNKFWRKFISICTKLQIDPAPYFKDTVWKNGKRYYERRHNGQVKSQ